MLTTIILKIQTNSANSFCFYFLILLNKGNCYGESESSSYQTISRDQNHLIKFKFPMLSYDTLKSLTNCNQADADNDRT